ncbi:hypothetical protein L9F63_000397, partial [Diploptera punctata]
LMCLKDIRVDKNNLLRATTDYSQNSRSTCFAEVGQPFFQEVIEMLEHRWEKCVNLLCVKLRRGIEQYGESVLETMNDKISKECQFKKHMKVLRNGITVLRDIEQYGESVLVTMNDKISSEFPQIGIGLCDINLTFKKNVNLNTYEGPKERNNRIVNKSVSYNNMPNITETISMPQLNEKQDDYNISQVYITIQRLLDDDENTNCQQVRRKKRKYNEISKPPQNIPSINVYNPYDTLMDDTENADNINSSQSTKPLPHKPPPIFIP